MTASRIGMHSGGRGWRRWLCAAAGRATPGSYSASWPAFTTALWQDKVCAYSPSDNYVVADTCSWAFDGRRPGFTHVSGSLEAGVGYMCAQSRCDHQVRVDGAAATGQYASTESCQRDPSCDTSSGIVTLNSGDAVFCSA